MHKLMEYICNELEELERKADKEGKLSAAEIEYIDKLTHIKKNLLRAEEMWEDSEYSMDGGSYARERGGRSNRGSSRRGGRSNAYEGGSNRSNAYEGGSYESMARGRNARRDSMGRYSRNDESEMMVQELRELMEEAPDDRTRQEFQRFIAKMEQM